MRKDWKITYFKPDRPGICYQKDGICFATEIIAGEDCGILLYDNYGEKSKIPFEAAGVNGLLAGVKIYTGEDEELCYNYYSGQTEYTDPYAPKVLGLETWGDAINAPRKTKGCTMHSTFDWQEDKPLYIPYEDSIIYGLDVRSYTMHKSAGVKHNGTFEGLSEKIPYLKSLGITALELLPCYEYEECMTEKRQLPIYAQNQTAKEQQVQEKPVRLNCWGFQKGYYFAPKASYSASKDVSASFKALVRSLHLNGIEILLHFYFPPEIKALYILEVLKFWVKEYHVDGFRISGIRLPHRLLTEDGVLKYTKLRFNYLPEEEIERAGVPAKTLALDNYGFFADMRKYLKGDEGMIDKVLKHQKYNPKTCGTINFITDYNSFSLYDTVSYEYKHNEANGEENKDGSDLNYSWNCGMEGETRKKNVLLLRARQMKNALALLFLSQGTPYLFAGDEMANTRYGNNNPYCQDNETGWVKWKGTKLSAEISEYTKELIALRKNTRIFHMPDALKATDAKGCGVPDISYHGTDAWKPDLGHMSRMIGIMLCGVYAGEEASYYIGFNMHWEEHNMALPKLPKDVHWRKIWDTAQGNLLTPQDTDNELMIQVAARSVVIYRTEKASVISKTPKKKPARKELKDF